MFSPDQLRDSLRRSVRVVIAAQIATQLVSLGVLAVLFRQLGPEPYGLLGMVVPLLLVVRILITAGLDVATIQQEELDDRRVSALFWLNQGLGLAMALVTAAMAPVLAWFYGVEQLTGLTLALAGTSVATVLGIQHQALLQRKLRLGTLAVVRLVALAFGGTAGIVAASTGCGVWSLVMQQYVELLTLALLVWAVEPWRPALVLRGTGSRPLVRFGGYYALSNLVFFVAANADKVLVGVVLGPRALGLYSQAFNLMMKPVFVVTAPVTEIMLPALSRAVGEVREYARLTLDFFRFIALAMLPAGVGLIIVAPEAIRVIGGPQWTEAGPILRAFSVAILVQGFFNAMGSVFASASRTDRLFASSLVIAAVLCTAFLVGLQLGYLAGRPVLGVAWSYSLTMLLIVFPPYLIFGLRTVGLTFGRWLAQLRMPASAAAVMGLVVGTCHFLLVGFPDPLVLGVEIPIGVVVYAALARREIRQFVISLGSRSRPTG